MKALLAGALLCGCMHVGGTAQADAAEDERQADYARGMEVYKAHQKALADWHDGEKQRADEAAAAVADPYRNDEVAPPPPPPPPEVSYIDQLRKRFGFKRSTPQRQRDADYVLSVFADTLRDPAAYGRPMFLQLGTATVKSDSASAMLPENANRKRVDLCNPERQLWNAADFEELIDTARATRDLKTRSAELGTCLDARILKHFGTYQKAWGALNAK